MNRSLPFTVALVTVLVTALCPQPCSSETLFHAWGEAIANNPQYAAAQLDHAAADAEVAAAAAARLPTVWAQGSYFVRSDQRSFQFDNPLAPGQRFLTPYSQREAAGASLGASAPLYTSGEIDSAVDSAAAVAQASVYAASAARLQLMLAIGEAYIAVLRSQRDLQVAEQNLASLAAHLDVVRRHFQQQRVARSDLLSAEVAMAMGEQQRLRRARLLETARGHYNRLLSRPLNAPVQLEELAFPSLLLGLDDMQRMALERRPDLMQLLASADARRFDAQRLRATSKPHVSAVGRHDFEENRYQSPQGVASAGVVVDWCFYDGGQSRRQAAAEQARAASIARLAEDLRSRICLDVLTEWNSGVESLARTAVAARALEHAEENLRVSKLRYEQGVAVESEVIDAQARRTQAAGDFYGAGYDAALAQLRLRYAIGILGDGQ